MACLVHKNPVMNTVKKLQVLNRLMARYYWIEKNHSIYVRAEKMFFILLKK